MTGSHECQIGLIIHGIITGITCRQPADRHYRIICLHEHLFEGWVCPRHIEVSDLNVCTPCLQADGHTCPLGLTETTTDGLTEKRRPEPADQKTPPSAHPPRR